MAIRNSCRAKSNDDERMSLSRVSKYCDVFSSNVKLTSEKMALKTGQYFQLDGLESLNRAASE